MHEHFCFKMNILRFYRLCIFTHKLCSKKFLLTTFVICCIMRWNTSKRRAVKLFRYIRA